MYTDSMSVIAAQAISNATAVVVRKIALSMRLMETE